MSGRNAYLVVPFHERFRHRFAPPLPGHKKLETLLLFSAAVMGLSRLGYAAGVPELVEMKSWILRNNSALTSSGTEARPCGVISRTRSSTSIFSMPFVLMTSARAPQSAQVEQEAAWQAKRRRLTDRRRRTHARTFAVGLQLIVPPTVVEALAQVLLQPAGRGAARGGRGGGQS